MPSIVSKADHVARWRKAYHAEFHRRSRSALASKLDAVLSERFPECYAKSSDGGWVTIGGSESGGKKHAGGTPVQLGEGGEITKGPAALKGKTISEIDKPDDDFELTRPRNKESVPKATQTQAFETVGPPEPQARPSRVGGLDSPSVQTTPDGRKVGVTMLGVSEMAADPARFQYKITGIDDSGVTDRLKDVGTFNPKFAGQLLAWYDPEAGQVFVVNGHHRFELAKRAGYEGQLPVYLLDSGDAREARAEGALANIAEDNGSSIDAAKYFRESGMKPEKLSEHGVSLKGKTADEGMVLSKLSDNSFAALANDRLPIKNALAVAQYVDDHEKQDELFTEIRIAEQRGHNVRPDAIEEMAQEYALASKVADSEAQGGLFADADAERSVVAERGILKAAVRRALSKVARAFTEVSRKGREEVLAEAGNVVNTEENRRRASEAQLQHETFARESKFKGETSDKLNEFAEQLADNPGREKELAEEFTRWVRERFSQADGGTAGSDSEGSGGTPEEGEGTGAGADRAKSGIDWDQRLDALEKRRGGKYGLRYTLERMVYSRRFNDVLKYACRDRQGQFSPCGSLGDQLAAETESSLDRSWRDAKPKHKSLDGQKSLFDDHDVRTGQQRKRDEAGRQKKMFAAGQGDDFCGQLMHELLRRFSDGPAQYKAGWNEDAHPRDEAGKFTNGGSKDKEAERMSGVQPVENEHGVMVFPVQVDSKKVRDVTRVTVGENGNIHVKQRH